MTFTFYNNPPLNSHLQIYEHTTASCQASTSPRILKSAIIFQSSRGPPWGGGGHRHQLKIIQNAAGQEPLPQIHSEQLKKGPKKKTEEQPTMDPTKGEVYQRQEAFILAFRKQTGRSPNPQHYPKTKVHPVSMF